MPKASFIQNNFNNGEISPLVRPRVDIQKYKSSCYQLRNFIVHPQGPASNRPGFRFVCMTKDPDTPSIVQEFIFNSDQTYILEIGDEYVRFITGGVQVEVDPDTLLAWTSSTSYVIGNFVTHASSTYYAIADNTNHNPLTMTSSWTQQSIYEIPSPYPYTDLSSLRFESSADTIFITHPDYKTRILQRYGATDWRFSEYDPDDGPFMIENLDDTITLTASAVSGTITLTSSSSVFVSTHVGALWKLRHYIPGSTASDSFSSATNGTSVKCFTTWRIITNGTWAGRITVQKSSDGGTTWTELRSFSSQSNANFQTSGTEDTVLNPEPFLVRAVMSTYTSGTALVDLSADPFFQDGIVRITTYTSSTSVGADVLTEIGSTSGTVSWFEGSWSDYRGYPAVCKFYQDRLCFGGTYAEPMTVWCSQTGSYFSFKINSTVLDTDSIVTNLPSRQLNAINGMVALSRLIVLTSSTEWSIGPGIDGVFSANQFEVKPEGYRGSSGLDPVIVGDEVIFIESNKKFVSNLSFNSITNNFTGSQINILAEHFFTNHTIVDVAYQRYPDSIVWFIRDDGRMIGMTYDKVQQVLAFHLHDTGVINV